MVLRRQRLARRLLRSLRGVVHIFQMAAQIAALSELLAADSTLEGGVAGVLSKVISEVA